MILQPKRTMTPSGRGQRNVRPRLEEPSVTAAFASKVITSPKHLIESEEGRRKETPTYSTQPGKGLGDLKAEHTEKYDVD